MGGVQSIVQRAPASGDVAMMSTATATLAFADPGEEDALEEAAAGGGGTSVLQLTPTQSCSLHGWSNPKRTLAWEDVARNPRITLQKCVEQGIPLQALHELQPDLAMWISYKQVGFPEVPLMATHWKLHPIVHLRGDISDLASMHYDPRVLQRLAIGYRYMREELHMDDDWMRMMRYKPKEWKEYLGFGDLEAEQMGDLRLEKVFLMDACMVRVAMHAH